MLSPRYAARLALPLALAALMPGAAQAQLGVDPNILQHQTRPTGPLRVDENAIRHLDLGPPVSLNVDVIGEGSLTVDGQTCASKPSKSEISCTLQISGGKHKAVATPGPGQTAVRWYWECNTVHLSESCSFPAGTKKIGVGFAAGYPLTVTIAPGPGYVDQQVDPAHETPLSVQCSADAAGKQGSGCIGFMLAGQKVTLKPNPGNGEVFVGFTSGPPGCAGVTCSFVPTGPVSVVAAFGQTAHLAIATYTKKDKHLSVVGGAGTKVTCSIVSGGDPGADYLSCGATVPKNANAVVNAYYAGGPGGTIAVPIPAADWGGACAGSPNGTCTVQMTGDKIAKIGG